MVRLVSRPFVWVQIATVENSREFNFRAAPASRDLIWVAVELPEHVASLSDGTYQKNEWMTKLFRSFPEETFCTQKGGMMLNKQILNN